MTDLFVFRPGGGMPSLSPFCTKTMVYFRLAGLPHKIRTGNPQRAPKGKLPYIRHEAGILGDSGIIERWCIERTGDVLDKHLSDPQRALAHLVRRTCEESVYFTLVWLRWASDEGWATMAPDVAAMMPKALRWVLPGVVRRGVVKSLKAQGTGRHDPAEIHALAIADLNALNTMVETGPFFFGEAPSSVDVVLFSFLGGLLWAPFENPVTTHLRGLTALVTLVEAVGARYEAA